MGSNLFESAQTVKKHILIVMIQHCLLFLNEGDKFLTARARLRPDSAMRCLCHEPDDFDDPSARSRIHLENTDGAKLGVWSCQQ